VTQIKKDADDIQQNGIDNFMPEFESIFDVETGERFFLNLKTGETVWLLPEGARLCIICFWHLFVTDCCTCSDQAALEAEQHEQEQQQIQELIKEGYLGFKDLKAWRSGEMSVSEALVLGMANKEKAEGGKKAAKAKKKEDKKARREARREKRK
jgi:hypothetical protein